MSDTTVLLDNCFAV